MVNVFFPIPDWFSHENAGANIAFVDRGMGASPDLAVLMVDNPGGQNRGLYSLGRALNGEGEVTGGWTPWTDVPDWFSPENQGAGLACADLNNNGVPDLVVLMVDNPGGQNRGVYRIGRGLDSNGQVTGGWSPWLDVPDWFSHENQGAAVSISPPDAQGRRDLAVFMIDNPAQLNEAKYRIGSNLDVDGNVDGWTPWIDVPGWFSWENQGCGVAFADIDNAGSRDLVIFQIDNAIDQNQAFYRIGRNLQAGGQPAGGINGWGPWLGVPQWFSFENQGGGIAVANVGGAQKLFVLMVDNPPGQNAGLYKVLDLNEDPATYGSWQVLPFLSEVLPVHAALLPTGRVLLFAGSGSSATRFRSPRFGDVAQGIFTSVVWDPPGNIFSHPPTLLAADGRPFDLFCGGDAFLADGRMLSAGGTLDYGPFKGRRDVAVFDHVSETWSFVAPMDHGRWYPTLITLGDGRILATTGLNEDGNGHNQDIEFYSDATNTWEDRDFAGGFPGLPLYAHLFLMADGRVFFSGGRMDDPLGVQPCIINLTQNPVATMPVPDLLDPDIRNQSASVILPPAQDQRVMVVGGGPVGPANRTDATDAVSIVDLRAANPAYVAAAPIGLPRLHLNTVLLPDRTVFAGGGSLKQEDAPLARLQAEIYDPATNTWHLMATATVPRLYHSTAVLLPDGRVLAAAGNPEGGDQDNWLPPDEQEEMRLEIFSPPYLFRGPRPVINAVPQEWSYGSNVDIQSPQAGGISWASLLKNCVTTHSFDSGQRLVDCGIVSQTGGRVRVAVTNNPNVAPPGWYMLFLVDQQGVPSVAQWVHLT